jgi:hypothetical protein
MGWLAAVVLMVLGALSGAQGFLNAVKPDGSVDFQWNVSRQLLEHENPYRPENLPFENTPVYPASAEIFLWPMAALSLDDAKWLWAAANVLFAIGCVVLVARMADVSGVAVLGLLGLFFAGTPVRNTIGNGQHGLFSLFFLLWAVDLRRQNKTLLAAVCLAACWLKYTITLPLSLVFITREWRTTLAIASLLHVGLTVFLAFWTGESPLNMLLGPFMLAGHAVAATMFDVIAIARYIGISSLIGPGSVGVALFIAVVVLMSKSNNDRITDLSLLSLVSLIWSYHRQYDYFILIIPLVAALKHWQHRMMSIADMLIVLSIFLIWFVQRILDSAALRFPENTFVALGEHVVFWVACLAIYTAFASYITSAYLQARHRFNCAI